MENEILKELLRVKEENGTLKKEIEYLKEKNIFLTSKIQELDNNMSMDDIWNMFK